MVQRIYGNEFNWQAMTNTVHANNLNVLECFGMLIFDAIIYLLLAIYLNNVVKENEHQKGKSFLFFLKFSYWRQKKKELQNTYQTALSLNNHCGMTNSFYENSNNDIEMQGEENCEPVGKEYENIIW